MLALPADTPRELVALCRLLASNQADLHRDMQAEAQHYTGRTGLHMPHEEKGLLRKSTASALLGMTPVNCIPLWFREISEIRPYSLWAGWMAVVFGGVPGLAGERQLKKQICFCHFLELCIMASSMPARISQSFALLHFVLRLRASCS